MLLAAVWRNKVRKTEGFIKGDLLPKQILIFQNISPTKWMLLLSKVWLFRLTLFLAYSPKPGSFTYIRYGQEDAAILWRNQRRKTSNFCHLLWKLCWVQLGHSMGPIMIQHISFKALCSLEGPEMSIFHFLLLRPNFDLCYQLHMNWSLKSGASSA